MCNTVMYLYMANHEFVKEIWIQCHRQSPIFSMESCLVAHEVRIGKDKRTSFS